MIAARRQLPLCPSEVRLPATLIKDFDRPILQPKKPRAVFTATLPENVHTDALRQSGADELGVS